MESIRSKMQAIVQFELLTFLERLDSNQLMKGTLLDLPHQTILRAVYLQNQSYINQYFIDYCSDKKARHKILDNVKNNIKQRLDKINFKPDFDLANGAKLNYRPGASYYIQNTEILENFLDFGQQIISEKDLLYARPYGFGYFENLEKYNSKYINAYICPSNEFVSVGLMMLYAYTFESKNSIYFLKESIEVMAETLYIISKQSNKWSSDFFDDNKFFGNEMNHYVSQFSSNTVDKNVIYEDCVKFLSWHEYGHLCISSNDDVWILEILKKASINPANLYHVGTPYHEMLGSWKRIRTGNGGVKEVLFLLGDFIANMNSFKLMSYSELVIMRLFHWWMLKMPKLKNRPRGFTAFLYCAITKKNDMVSHDFLKVLDKAKNAKHQLANSLMDFENKYWLLLTENSYDMLIANKEQ